MGGGKYQRRCVTRTAARVNRKVYKTAVRPAVMYGLETVALSRRQEAELDMAEIKSKYSTLFV